MLRKKKALFIILGVFLLTLFSKPPHIFALGEEDLEITWETPSITPPDYSKNECPVCDLGSGYQWMGDKGCCKMDVKTDKILGIIPHSVKFKFQCQQPDIVVCALKSLKLLSYCLPGIGCSLSGQQKASFQPVELCTKLGDPSEQNKCTTCMNDGKHVWSTIGCLPTEFGALISTYILSLSLGVGGGISFLVFLYGAFLIIASAGETERISLGKKHISSAIKGLLLIIFAVFILKVIGADLLRIPGFR